MNRLATAVALLALTAAQLSAQSGTLDVGDATIRYEVTGLGSPLVLIHGWAQDLSIWDREVPVFAREYRVIRYDRRGYGRSTGHADPSADPADLRALLDHLNIRSAAVLGLSAGAETALRFTTAWPERTSRLVLYGFVGIGLPGFPGAVGGGENPMLRLVGVAQQHGLDSLWGTLISSPMFWSPPDQPMPANPPEWWRNYSGQDILDPKPPSGKVPAPRWEQMPDLRVPTLILHGDHDMPQAVMMADSLMARLPNAHRAVIESAGHGAHFQRPAEFQEAVMRFLGGER